MKAPTLRPLEMKDDDAVYSILQNPAVRLPFALYSEPHFNRDSVTGWCKLAADHNKQATDINKFFLIEQERKIIGYFSGGPDTEEPDNLDRWEVGYFLDPAYQGRGIITHFVSDLIAQARKGNLTKEFFAAVSPANHASGRVLEKNGFSKTGVDKDWQPYIIDKDGNTEMALPAKIMDIYTLKL